VAERGQKTFVFLMGNKKEKVSVDRLKPHLGLAPVTPALVRQRGPHPLMCPLHSPMQTSQLGGAPVASRMRDSLEEKILQSRKKKSGSFE